MPSAEPRNRHVLGCPPAGLLRDGTLGARECATCSRARAARVYECMDKSETYLHKPIFLPELGGRSTNAKESETDRQANLTLPPDPSKIYGQALAARRTESFFTRLRSLHRGLSVLNRKRNACVGGRCAGAHCCHACDSSRDQWPCLTRPHSLSYSHPVPTGRSDRRGHGRLAEMGARPVPSKPDIQINATLQSGVKY